MSVPTLPQINWLKKLFLAYFPHVSIHDCPMDIFNGYLRFATTEQPLILPLHLQFNGELELDVPKMLGEEPFLGLVKKEYLKELREKINREPKPYDIFGHLMQKDEALFVAKFKDLHPTYSDHEENAYKLFKEKAFWGHGGNIGKYDAVLNGFTWDFTGMFSLHKPKEIYDAYRYFAHKVYNLRAFGMWREEKEASYKAPADYAPLRSHLDDYLKDSIPFYHEILRKRDSYLKTEKTNAWKMSAEEVLNSNLIGAFAEMVNNELETVTKGTEIHSPTAPVRLIESIANKSNVTWLTTKYDIWYNDPVKKSIDEEIPGSEDGKAKLSDILSNSDSVFEYEETSFEDEDVFERIRQRALECVRREFPTESEKEFAQMLEAYFLNSNIAGVKEKTYAIKQLFGYYAKLCGITTADKELLKPIEKLFNKKMRKILHSIMETVERLNN